VLAADEGQPFWFLNCLAINKINSDDSQGLLSIADHRMPAGFAPPPHIHQASDEAFLVMDGELDGFCGEQAWRAGPGSLVYLPHGIPHGFTVCGTAPGRIIVVVTPGGFDQFVAAAGEPAGDLRLPEPAAPDPVRITQLAAAHGIQILLPPNS
jgi:mannose-6-phosphate isomerase-like protein (cupin superfamily)